jgi:asparagine synthase (glutamine-hydrolysing)
MCGITGFIDFTKKSERNNLEEMVHAIRHRGPDDFGVEIQFAEKATIGLSQARLSIIDLSSGGHQPMRYKKLSIVFNGEIYNYKEIRFELEQLGHNFNSQSDTEVILHAVDQWGQEAVSKFIGMFVFCIYDEEKDDFIITRDRAGVKPLYYYYKEGLFLFGSELKSVIIHPAFTKEIAPEVMPLYLQYGYIPAPHSIYKDCYKLLPGNRLILDLKTKKISFEQYWNPIDFYEKEKYNITYTDAKHQVHELLKSACNYRMVADVPVGVFLSGGYDSTAVTAILQSQQTEKLKTFTIGFEEGNNEAPYAKETAFYLGTEHTEYYCTKKEAQEIIPTLPFFYDEPFGDSSVIPTILVSQLAKKKVTVALSADAGDELFCGYSSYFKTADFVNQLNRVPNFFKSTLNSSASFFQRIPMGNKVKQHQIVSYLKALDSNQNNQIRKLFQYMNEKPQSYCEQFLLKTSGLNSPFEIDCNNFKNSLEIPMAIDYKSYLPNDILTKVDRATMSVSLEGREPFLDHRLFEYVAQLPYEFKVRNHKGKFILKDIVHDYIPEIMMNRPKTGFSIPINSWLRSDLKDLISEFLSEENLMQSGLFNVPFVLKEVNKFNDNKLHYTPIIWYVLMFQMWYKKWM